MEALAISANFNFFQKGGMFKMLKKLLATTAVLAMALAFSLSAQAMENDAPAAQRDEISQNITLRVNDLLLGSRQQRAAGIAPQGEALSPSAKREYVDQIIRDEYQKNGWREVSTMPHTAAQVWETVNREMDQKAVRLAYMDLDQTPEDLKDYILSARRAVIYQFAWTADPADKTMCYSIEPREDHTFEITPRFSDLFPGWYEPQIDLELPDWKDAPEEALASLQDASASFLQTSSAATADKAGLRSAAIFAGTRMGGTP